MAISMAWTCSRIGVGSFPVFLRKRVHSIVGKSWYSIARQPHEQSGARIGPRDDVLGPVAVELGLLALPVPRGEQGRRGPAAVNEGEEPRAPGCVGKQVLLDPFRLPGHLSSRMRIYARCRGRNRRGAEKKHRARNDRRSRAWRLRQAHGLLLLRGGREGGGLELGHRIACHAIPAEHASPGRTGHRERLSNCLVQFQPRATCRRSFFEGAW